MREGRGSSTAEWVAALRGLAPLLPDEARLADDVYGAAFGGSLSSTLRRAALRRPRLLPVLSIAVAPLRRSMVWMQLRTRALDEALLEFVKASGRQVVILGAGYDARAWRFARELDGAQVFEIDHPSTQARKRRMLSGMGVPPARVSFLPFDFERTPLAELPERLEQLGHSPTQRTLVLWEGVTPYLTARMVDDSLAALRALCAPGSLLAFTYIEKEAIEHPRGEDALFSRIVARVGEPYRFGIASAEVGAWLNARGLRLVRDDSHADLARRLLPRAAAQSAADVSRHVALARFP
ncbi:MAG: class I SAM-dependent methyltransferase [Deltaproteobacteria bacterium]